MSALSSSSNHHFRLIDPWNQCLALMCIQFTDQYFGENTWQWHHACNPTLWNVFIKAKISWFHRSAANSNAVHWLLLQLASNMHPTANCTLNILPLAGVSFQVKVIKDQKHQDQLLSWLRRKRALFWYSRWFWVRSTSVCFNDQVFPKRWYLITDAVLKSCN